MKISELSALLSKVTQIAGDVEVVLHNAVDEAETIITDLGIHLAPSTGATGSTLTITHDVAPAPAVAAAAPADPAADPAAASEQAG